MARKSGKRGSEPGQLRLLPYDKVEYYGRKKELLIEEKTNYSRIVLMEGRQNFWIAVGHSAILLSTKVVNELGARFSLHQDSDYSYKSKEGIVSIAESQLENYRRILTQTGFSKLVKQGEKEWVFELKRPVSEEEFEIYSHQEELAIKQLENDVIKVIPMPKTHRNLIELIRITNKIYEKRTKSLIGREFSRKLMENLGGCQRRFLMMCMDEIPLEETLKDIDAKLIWAKAAVVQLAEQKFWEHRDAVAANAAILQVQLAITQEKQMAIARRDKIRELRRESIEENEKNAKK